MFAELLFLPHHPQQLILMSRAKIREKIMCPKVNRQSILGRKTLLARGNWMTARAGVWKRKREDLKKKRTPLFRRYEKSPGDLHLALDIKMIDDQIAECTRQMERENALAGASARSSTATSGQRTRPAPPIE
jgi:hypothetical protein